MELNKDKMVFEMMDRYEMIVGDEQEMIELLADSWEMVVNEWKMMTDDNSLYRRRSQCGANINTDCTAIG